VQGVAVSARTDLLSRVNAEVNLFPYATDYATFGCQDLWRRIGLMKRGDCDDYAMEKRFRLIEAGVPVEDLRLASCLVETGERHLVLLCTDEDGGDWILDNRQPAIFTRDTFMGLGYHGESLQIPGEWYWQEWR
jgi:predicted transglutaminase-like cysteine proteinase